MSIRGWSGTGHLPLSKSGADGDCRIDTGVPVGRPEGAATNQPRASPWDPGRCPHRSPEGARHRRACPAPSGLAVGWTSGIPGRCPGLICSAPSGHNSCTRFLRCGVCGWRVFPRRERRTVSTGAAERILDRSKGLARCMNDYSIKSRATVFRHVECGQWLETVRAWALFGGRGPGIAGEHTVRYGPQCRRGAVRTDRCPRDRSIV